MVANWHSTFWLLLQDTRLKLDQLGNKYHYGNSNKILTHQTWNTKNIQSCASSKVVLVAFLYHLLCTNRNPLRFLLSTKSCLVTSPHQTRPEPPGRPGVRTGGGSRASFSLRSWAAGLWAPWTWARPWAWTWPGPWCWWATWAWWRGTSVPSLFAGWWLRSGSGMARKIVQLLKDSNFVTASVWSGWNEVCGNKENN